MERLRRIPSGFAGTLSETCLEHVFEVSFIRGVSHFFTLVNQLISSELFANGLEPSGRLLYCLFTLYFPSMFILVFVALGLDETVTWPLLERGAAPAVRLLFRL